MDEFFSWLNAEIDRRGWSVSELSRHAGMSRSTFHATMTGRNVITWDFCAGVARAFHLPPEQVFRRAGLLPAVPDPAGVQALVDVARQLDSESLGLLTEFAHFLHGRGRGSRR